MLVGQVLGPLEQAPTRMLQDVLVAVGLELLRLGGADLVNGLVHFGRDVEAIKYMQGLAHFLGAHWASRALNLPCRLKRYFCVGNFSSSVLPFRRTTKGMISPGW